MWYICIFLLGTFDFTRIVIANGAHYYHGVWAADINGDSKLDILAGRQVTEPGALWYEQTANINVWNPYWIQSGGSNIMEIAAAKFDADADWDVVYSDWGASQIWVSENLGGGSFSHYLVSSGVSYPRQVIPADVNKDGLIDFVIGTGTTSPVYWFRNNGGWSFTQLQVSSLSLVEPWKIDVFDGDGDGHMEVVAAGQGGTSVYWFQNDGFENFAPILVSNTISAPAGVGAGDFDGDGLWDVAVCEFVAGGRVLWYENMGGSFNEHLIQSGVNNCDGLDVGDIDLDGDPDIVVGTYNTQDIQDGTLRLYENTGGSFATWIIDNTNIINGDLPFIVDIDQDSCPDILLSDNYIYGYLLLYHQKCETGTESHRGGTHELSCKVFPTPATNMVNFILSIPYNGRAELKIYDIGGRPVYECTKDFSTGTHSINWDTIDSRGSPVISGAYFYKLKLNHQEVTGKFIITKR